MKRAGSHDRPFLGCAAAIALAAGCAAPFRSPAQGGPAWRELTSEHFTLSTDLSGDDAQVAIRDLEEYRAALLATGWPGSREPDGRLRVVILARERDWREFESEHNGFFTEALFQPLIALRAGATDQTRLTIRHELTHHLSGFYVRRQPRWLSEGLATFFETLVYDRSRGEILIGLPQPARLAVLRAGDLSVARTVSGALESEASERFYATSWLLVHYLISRERAAFTRYMQALDAGADDAQAWRAGFADLSPEMFQGVLRSYWGEGRPLVGSRAFRAPPFSVTQRPLDDASVHALRALLCLRGLRQQESPAAASAARTRARGEIDQALASDPDNVLALAVLGLGLEAPVDLARARATTLREPDNWLAWALLYRSAGADLSSAESRGAAATALRLAALNPAVKPPFGPPRSPFGRGHGLGHRHGPPAPPTLCHDKTQAPQAAHATPGADRPCARLTPQESHAELRAIAASDVSWCLFEHPSSPMVAVTIDTDGQGRPSSVCISGAQADDPNTACLQSVLTKVVFPAPGACPRRRSFELALTPDGRVTVFGTAK